MKFAIALLIAATSSVSAAPVNAQEQLQKDAALKAATAITNYDLNQDKDAKTAAKYDAMDAAAKKKWDDARKIITDARKKRDDEEKTAVGFDKMTLTQQKDYSADLLTWKTAKDKACVSDAKAMDCKYADKLRKAQEDKRKIDKYYEMASAADKAAWQTKYKDEDTKVRAGITASDADYKKKDDADKKKAADEKAKKEAADKKAAADLTAKNAADKKKKEDEAKKKAEADKTRLRTTGESCAKPATGDAPKCAETHCCGTAKVKGKTTGALTICNTKASKDYKKGTATYEFACTTKATYLVASAAAFLATSYMV